MPLIPSYNMMVHLQKICISAVTDKQAPGTRQKNATSNATGKSVATLSQQIIRNVFLNTHTSTLIKMLKEVISD